MEQIDCNHLLRWVMGLGIDDAAWCKTTLMVNERIVDRDFAPHDSLVRLLRAAPRGTKTNGCGWCRWAIDQVIGLTNSGAKLSGLDAVVVAGHLE